MYGSVARYGPRYQLPAQTVKTPRYCNLRVTISTRNASLQVVWNSNSSNVTVLRVEGTDCDGKLRVIIRNEACN